MKKRLNFFRGSIGLLAVVVNVTTAAIALQSVAQAEPSSGQSSEQRLFVVYPPDKHETTAERIFLIGTAAPAGSVTINGQPVTRSRAGHFAPSFPLQLGENVFNLRYRDQSLTLRIKRNSTAPPAPLGNNFAVGSLSPAIDMARLPGELICFGAIAPAHATVVVKLANQTIPLLPQPRVAQLPPNAALLTSRNQPMTATPGTTAQNSPQNYQGCLTGNQFMGLDFMGLDLLSNRSLGQPEFLLTQNGQTLRQLGSGKVEILSPVNLRVIEVIAESGTARTGPSTDYSRLTPLPRGTRASVTAREGEWLRLDYGGWIKAAETQVLEQAVPPRSIIRSARTRQVGEWTEVLLPLQVAVPVSLHQGTRSLTLTLHNTIAQTDTIRTDDDPVIQRLDWQQLSSVATGDQVQYTFNLKSDQQWGYKLRYEGTTLILSLRHPPQRSAVGGELSGVRILLDPGHGGPEDLGSRGPNGYPEKAVALKISQMVRDRLQRQGATVLMTREGDIDLWPNDRAKMIDQQEPTIALSLHYNALPDDGDAAETMGVSTFWYQAQAHGLAMFMHNYLTQKLHRPSYGVYWNNLALTRPAVCPAVLLELGFMINPQEFEWITDAAQQEKLADAIAQGIVAWFKQVRDESSIGN